MHIFEQIAKKQDKSPLCQSCSCESLLLHFYRKNINKHYFATLMSYFSVAKLYITTPCTVCKHFKPRLLSPVTCDVVQTKTETRRRCRSRLARGSAPLQLFHVDVLREMFATSSYMRASDENRAHWRQRGPLMLLFG